MQKNFVINNVLGWGWQIMKTYFWYFVGIAVLAGLANILPDFLRGVLVGMSEQFPLAMIPVFILWLLGIIISIVVNIGFIKIALSFCDRIKPTVGTLFDAWDCFWRYAGVSALYGLIVFAGILLLIIPGIIWAVQFCYSFYFVVDKGLGPMEALKASSRTTRGIRLKLFGFGLLCGLINMLGALCLLVGLFVTYPVVLTANALVYRHLLVQTPELAEFGIQMPQPETQPETQPENENY